MAEHWKKAPSVKKTFPKPEPTEQYEKPIGPTRPSTEDKIRGAIDRVKGSRIVTGFMDRSREVAAENARAPRGKRARIPSNAGITDPGMGSNIFGGMGGGSGANIMNMNPFGVGKGMAGPFGNTPRAAPKKKSKRRKPRVSGDDGHFDPMGIPDHMKWMF